MSSLSRGTKEEIFSIVPAGVVLPYAGASAPAGWAFCDGSTVNRVDYPELFLALGTAHGEGDGSTTFHLPDYRGRFLRGADNAAGRDPDAGGRTAANAGGNTGDNVGSVQDAVFADHDHNLPQNTFIPLNQAGTGFAFGSGTLRTVVSNHDEGGNETRPVNANINYIIKL